MNNLLLRRRALMSMGSKSKDDPWAGLPDGIRLRAKNTGDNNIIGRGNENVDKVDSMYVDGVSVTPVLRYEFADSAYHNVLLVLKDNTKLGANFCWYASPKAPVMIDFPSTVMTFQDQSVRGMSAGADFDIIFRATSMPNFGSYNFISWDASRAHIYVPSALVNSYKTMLQNDSYGSALADRVFALEDSPYNK